MLGEEREREGCECWWADGDEERWSVGLGWKSGLETVEEGGEVLPIVYVRPGLAI